MSIISISSKFLNMRVVMRFPNFQLVSEMRVVMRSLELVVGVRSESGAGDSQNLYLFIALASHCEGLWRRLSE